MEEKNLVYRGNSFFREKITMISNGQLPVKTCCRPFLTAIYCYKEPNDLSMMTEDLNKMTTEELGLLFPIILVDYDPSWVKIYLHEKENILKTLRQCSISGIEHIGSTAIPGICSKPTIDILSEIPDDTDTDLLIRDLKGIQYQYIPKPENPPPHIMLAKGYSKKGYTGQTFHIHIRYAGYRDEIIFRDYLVKNPDIAQQYNDLKKELSTMYKNDREKYTDGIRVAMIEHNGAPVELLEFERNRSFCLHK